MRGVKYNSRMTLRDGTEFEINNFDMISLCDKLEDKILEEYGVKIKITHNKLYNIMKRPKFVNSILKDTIKLQVYKKEKNTKCSCIS